MHRCHSVLIHRSLAEQAIRKVSIEPLGLEVRSGQVKLTTDSGTISMSWTATSCSEKPISMSISISISVAIVNRYVEVRYGVRMSRSLVEVSNVLW